MKTLEPLRKTFVGCRGALTFIEINTKNYILLKKLHLFQLKIKNFPHWLKSPQF